MNSLNRQQHDRLRMMLGAYVLGALDAADRAEVDEHIAACRQCRDEVASFASVPAVLQRARDLPRVEAELDPVPPIGIFIEAAKRQRTKRRRVAMMAAAGLAIVAITITPLVTSDVAPRPGSALVAVSDGSEHGEIRVAEKPWGTELTVQVNGLPNSGRFSLWTIGRSGGKMQAATWSATSSGNAQLTGASAMAWAEVIAVEIQTESGQTLMRASV